MDGEERTPEDLAKERMGNISVTEVIRRAHEGFIRGLAAKAEVGSLTVQEMAVLRNLLRDNGMMLGIPPEEPLKETTRPDLPDLKDPEYD